MAVKIRLSRVGKKNSPVSRIVAIDSRKKRDGEFLENLGTYDQVHHSIVQLHVERINAWVAQGAICTPAVLKIVKMHKRTATESAS